VSTPSPAWIFRISGPSCSLKTCRSSKEQHGLAGHLLGGWALSANYILASGQRYTPVQAFSAFAFASGNPYDINFLNAFVGFDTARPFMGSLNAAPTAVGAFAQDACNVLGVTGSEPVCVLAGTSPSTLVNFTALRKDINSAPLL